MDATTRAIAYVLRLWHENERPPATVTDLQQYRQQKAAQERKRAPQPPRGGQAA